MKKLVTLLIMGFVFISLAGLIFAVSNDSSNMNDTVNNNANYSTNINQTSNISLVCNSNNLDGCLDESNCTIAGGGWDNDVCCSPIPNSKWCSECNIDEKGNECLCPMKKNTRGCTEWDCNSCIQTSNISNSNQSARVCCHSFGYGAQMKKVQSKYQWKEKSECKIPENLVGGGMEIVSNELCKNQIKNMVKAINRVRFQSANECPQNCTCDGSTTKCQVQGGREMTIRAGNSGNTIIQIKGINMSTKVELYKENETIYGVFKNNNTREIKVFPDQIKERIKEQIKQKECDCEDIELDENGMYQVQTRKKARLFGLFPVRERVRIELNSETGEIIRTRTSWWGFLARDVKEDLA